MFETTSSADGTSIAFERSGAGPALIITVGALCARNSVDGLIPLLSEDFTVYSYDRRGRGDSGNTAPYGVDREVEDLQAVLAAAGGTACLYGHSSGGILALITAAETPGFTKVAVYEPPFATNPNPGFAEHIEELLAEGRRDEVVADWMRNTGAPFEEGWKYAPFWPGLVALADSLPYDIALTGDGKVPGEKLKRVSAETIALYGGASDKWASDSASAVAAAIPGARVQALAGQTHQVAHEAVAPVLVDFFQ